jgi:hypothetical protein
MHSPGLESKAIEEAMNFSDLVTMAMFGIPHGERSLFFSVYIMIV